MVNEQTPANEMRWVRVRSAGLANSQPRAC
jgi:hypothetical protein